MDDGGPNGERGAGRRRPTRLGVVVVAIAIIVVVATAIGGGLPGLFGPGGLEISGVEVARAGVARASADPADAVSAGAAIDAFGVDLYHRLAGSKGNVVFSPTSIVFSLAMARPGAKGATAAGMDVVMHNAAADANAGWLDALDAILATRNGTFKDASDRDADVALRLADGAFAQKGMAIVPAYLDALARRFGIGLQLVDYATDPRAAERAIDAWVSARTDGRIPTLIAPGSFDASTRLMLVNAIYLKAAWAIPFNPDMTSLTPFTDAHGNRQDVPTMTMGDAVDLGYASGAGWQAVELPYAGGALAMTIVLPDDLATFERTMTAESLASIGTSVSSKVPVYLWLPRFTIQMQTDLSADLGALGMADALNAADFSGIAPNEGLVISGVVHHADITVGEKGTEASAATSTVLQAVGRRVGSVDVRVDHPFLFLVRDVPTGAILFMGRVQEPAASSAIP